MLPIHRPYMHLSHRTRSSYQMCQHHKDKAVFLDQTFDNYLVFNEPTASLSVSFNDTCTYCVPPPTHTTNVFCALMKRHWQRKTEIPEDKLIAATLCPRQVPHRLNLDRTWPGHLEIRVRVLISIPNATWQCYHYESRNGNQVLFNADLTGVAQATNCCWFWKYTSCITNSSRN